MQPWGSSRLVVAPLHGRRGRPAGTLKQSLTALGNCREVAPQTQVPTALRWGMDERQRARRPGGRGARVRAAVHQAVTDLISERGYGTFSVGEVAARAGVADSSIYRRWGSLETLLADVALSRLNARSPMPDTGSLAGDLHPYAANVAREITGPDGLALLRLAVAL